MIPPSHTPQDKLDLLRCQINRLLYVVSDTVPTPQLPATGPIDDSLLAATAACATFLAAQPDFKPITSFPSWQHLLAFQAQPTAPALELYVDDLVGLFFIGAEMGGVVDPCGYTLEIAGFWPPAADAPPPSAAFTPHAAAGQLQATRHTRWLGVIAMAIGFGALGALALSFKRSSQSTPSDKTANVM